jgi:hypothetical protein
MRKRERGGQAGSPAVLEELEEERLVGPVDLVAGHRVSQPGGVNADLMETPGPRLDLGEGVAAG